jgi:uncharacterized Zn-binding protein involved in type VI secretion
MAGPPDTGVIITVLPPFVTANGMPLATAGGTICQMINSLSGIPYPMLIGPLGSSGVRVSGRALLRMGDRVPTPPGMMLILGPPATVTVNDQWPP